MINYNVKELTMDVQATGKHNIEITQYDKAALKIKVLDGGKVLDLTAFSSVQFTHLSQDGQPITHEGEINENHLLYLYAGSEMDQLGIVRASFALIDSNGNKVSSRIFNLHVMPDLRNVHALQVNERIDVIQDIKNQIKEIKGIGGIKGEKGDPFVFSDFTAEQIELLRGPSGKDGENLEIRINENVIPNTVYKMKVGLPISVCIMGDSLAEGGTSRWMNMLFNENYNGQGAKHPLYLPDKYGSTFSFVNMAIGGQTAILPLSQLGYERDEVLKSGSFANQSINSTSVFAPPILQKYDLFIISVGTNGGDEREFMAEKIARLLHNADKDVIFTTSNPRTDNANFANTIETTFLKLANFYRVGVANTNDYYKKAISEGTSINQLNSDVVHQSLLGHELYAKAIYDVIENSYNSTAVKPKIKVRTGIVAHSNYNVTNVLPTAVELQMPVSHTGTEQTINITDPRNPWYERYGTMKIITLTVGQRVKFASNSGYGFNILHYLDRTTNGKVQVKVQDGSTDLGTTIQLGNGTDLNRIEVVEGVNTGGYYGHTPANRPFILECTAGTVKIAGVAIYAHATKELPQTLRKVGTFETLTAHGSDCIASNDDAMSVEGDFYGEGLQLNFLSSRAGRKVDIYIDGKLITNIDTYSTLSTEYQVVTFTQGGFENTKHRFKLVINGANDSVIEPNDSNIKDRKFILHSLASFVNLDLNLLKHI